MRYRLENGKTVNIPNKELESLMNSLNISQSEAIDLWLCDNDYETDDEQKELEEKAKNIKISKEITPKKEKKERKPPVKKVSDEKKELFNDILTYLQSKYGEKVEVVNENKLIFVKINDKTFKLDLIQTKKA